VVAEEGSGNQNADAPWTWLVDPLDGTNNLAIGLPAYVVGIALCWYGRPVVGVVHDPITGHTWSAIRDQGAFVRGGPGGTAERQLRSVRRPIPVTPVLGWTQGHDVARDDSAARALKVVLDSTARRVLQLWAPLLCWTMLARGDIDGIIGYRPEAVDLPAGLLIATEAGMSVRTLDGCGFDDRFGRSSEQRSFVAGPPETIDRLVGLVATARWLEPELRRLDPVGLVSHRW
jgi:myo-inositol-1(or 4)-monophosphatase